jgi:serine/threonine protein kinase
VSFSALFRTRFWPELEAEADCVTCSFSCILGEMVNKRPIIQGNSDQEQLQKIWHLCGLPTQENFPEWDQHGGCPGEGEAAGLQNQLMVPPPHLWDEVRWTRRIVSDFGRCVSSCPSHPAPISLHDADLTVSTSRHDGLYADLIDQCLTLDPAKRPTAMELLSHEFFTSLPPPAKIGTYVLPQPFASIALTPRRSLTATLL